MSDNDTQEPVAAEEATVEFSDLTRFDEPGDTPAENAEPETEPTAESDKDTVEEPTEEVPADDKEQEESEPAEPEKPEEKTESELKGMTRAERRDYFESQRQQSQKEVDQAIDANYQPQPLEQLKEHYLNEGYDDFQATMLAKDTYRDQLAEIDKAKTEIIELNANLRTDSLEAQSKYDWMNPKTDSYDRDLHNMAAELFAQGMQVDPRTGQIIEARMTPMQAAEIIDKARNSGITKAQLKARKAAEAEMAAVAPPSSSAPPASVSDEDKQATRLEQALNNAR